MEPPAGSRQPEAGRRQPEAGRRQPEDVNCEPRADVKPLILVVDDEPGVRSALSGVLRDEGYQVDAVESGEACLDRLARTPYDVVLLDVWLPGADGLATLEMMR